MYRCFTLLRIQRHRIRQDQPRSMTTAYLHANILREPWRLDGGRNPLTFEQLVNVHR
jgi:hypothetical protein